MKKLLKTLMVPIIVIGFVTGVYATASNYTTFVDGNVLNASDLNNLQTHYTNAINATLNGEDYTGDNNMLSGSDWSWFSDASKAVLTAKVFGDSGKIIGSTLKDGPYALNVSLTAGTFKIECQQTACSALNPGYVYMDSVTAGDKVLLRIDEDTHLFVDDTGTSDILGEEFGVTSGVAWGNSRPFYLYLANHDDDETDMFFFISPNPVLRTTPSSTTNIGYHGSPMSSPSDSGIFALTDTDVTARTSKPAILLGSFTMTMSASDDWTVDTLTDGTDGIGHFQEGEVFSFPTGQMGAVTGRFMKLNAGTSVPQFTSQTYYYKVGLDGFVEGAIYMDGDGGTDGVGAVTTLLATPYITASPDFYITTQMMLYEQTNSYHFVMPYCSATSSSMYFVESAGVNLSRLNDWADGDRLLYGGYRIKAF